MSILSFFAAYILPALVLLGAIRGGAYAWAALVFAVVGHTLLEYAFNRILRVAAPVYRQAPRLGNLILYGYVPIQTCVLFVALQALGNPAWPWVDQLGLALSTGSMTGGIGITAAHELIHRRTSAERGMGLWLLLHVLYMQFEIEHIRGHHRYVATPLDIATARKGESVYAFVPRTFVASYRQSADLERQAGRTGWRSHLNRYVLMQIAAAAGVAAVFGWLALPWFLVQSGLAIFYLEAVNYIEHYGLVRHQLTSGRFADVDESHSWDTYSAVTNAYLFKLGFHSDHHIAAARPYPLLRTRHDAADVLPAGYSGMILLSLVPPLWRSVMDWRVDRRLTANAAVVAPRNQLA